MRTLRAIGAGCALVVCGPPASEAAASDRSAGGRLAVLTAAHRAYAAPSTAGPIVARVAATRPITGVRTTLPVLSEAVGAGSRLWLRVRLPGRAVGEDRPPPTAWIAAAATYPAVARWRLVVDLRARRVHAYRDGEPVLSFSAIVGRPSTRTPTGEYFVEENVRLPAHRAGAPFALATSSRSAVFQEFDGGPGQIALHGRGGVGGRLGTAVSHGCVRLARAPITRLATLVRPGTPVSIVGAARRPA